MIFYGLWSTVNECAIHDDDAEGLSQGLDIGCVSLCRSNIDTKSSGCHVGVL